MSEFFSYCKAILVLLTFANAALSQDVVYDLSGTHNSNLMTTLSHDSSMAMAAPDSSSIKNDDLGNSSSGKDSLIELPEVVTYGKRISPLSTKIDLDSVRNRSNDLGTVLESVSGVNVQRTGGTGSRTTLSIHGSTSKQVQVLLDGVPMNNMLGGDADIGAIPTGTIGSVTVDRVLPPLEYDGENAGGTVELTSRESDTSAVNGSVGVGSFGYRNVNAFMSHGAGKSTHRIIIDGTHSDNDFNFGYKSGYYTDEPVQTRKIDNGEFSSLSGLYGCEFNGRIGKLSGSVGFARTETGIFSMQTVGGNDGSITDVKFDSRVKASCDVGKNSDLSAMVGFSNVNSRFKRDTTWYINGVKWDVSSAMPDFSATLCGAFHPVPALTVKSIVAGSVASYSGEDNIQSGRSEAVFRRWMARGGTEFSWKTGFDLQASLRGLVSYERDSCNGVKFDFISSKHGPVHSGIVLPAFAFETGMPVGEHFSFYLAASSRKRTPDLFERYGFSTGSVGNPELKPETRNEADLGFSFVNKVTDASAAGWIGRTHDKIVFVTGSNGILVPMNLPDILAEGADLSLRISPWEFVSLSNTSTLTHSLIRSSDTRTWVGKREPRVPRASDKVSLKIRFWKLEIFHDAVFSDGYYIGADNIYGEWVEGYYRLSAGLGFSPNKLIRVVYRIENYTDRSSYDASSVTDSYNPLPMPGRSQYLTVNISF